MRRDPVILMYHGVADVAPELDPDNLFVTPDSFEQQMAHLADHGHRVLGEDALLAWERGASLPGRSVILTFDDGYRSVAETAAPILQRFGFPAVCYVSAGLLGTRSSEGDHLAFELMDADEVAALPAAGVAVASHGWDHSSMRGAAPQVLRRATEDAMESLSDLTGRCPASFAYPYGHHDEIARSAVRRAGYQAALATYDGAGRWARERVDVNATDTLRTFRWKLTAPYPHLRALLGRAPRLRRAAHRMVGFADRPAAVETHS